MHAGGPVVNQGRVTIAQVLDVDLLDFGFFRLETRQADFNSLVVEKIFQRLEGRLILLIANQVHARRAAGCGLWRRLVALGLLALPAGPQ